MYLLILSYFLGHENIVRLLIENGADIDAQDEYGIKPLHYAVYKGDWYAFKERKKSLQCVIFLRK